MGLATVARIEQGEGMVQGNFSTITKIQQALERHVAFDIFSGVVYLYILMVERYNHEHEHQEQGGLSTD